MNPQGESRLSHRLFPIDDVFRPILANPKEPRFFASYQYADLNRALNGVEGADGVDGDEGFNAATVGFGETFGLWTMRREGTCHGVQVGFLGGVFSKFNLDTPSANLLNSDFQFGVQVTAAWKWLSGRLRIYHQSSHLGDEFLIYNPDFDRVDLNFEALELLAAITGSWWRVYAGGGYLVHVFPGTLDRGLLQAGAEARISPWSARSFVPTGNWAWVTGVDTTSYQERDWGLTVSAKTGLELAARQTGRRIRANIVFSTGYFPFGQFFDTRKMTNVGAEAQFEF